MSDQNPASLLEKAKEFFSFERRKVTMSQALYQKYKKRIDAVIKKYSEPLQDGFQVKDIGALIRATCDLVDLVEGIGDLSGEEKKSVVVEAIMVAYGEHGKNLPWWAKMMPESWVRSAAESAVDALVDYLNKKNVL